MPEIFLQEKQTSTALFQFILPFQLKKDAKQQIFPLLNNLGLSLFRLNNMEEDTAYYGDWQVSGSKMEAFFLPSTKRIIFPLSEEEKGLHRYSKKINSAGQLNTTHLTVPFQLYSVDVLVCPYELGFFTIRMEVHNQPLSHIIEFARLFHENQNSFDLSGKKMNIRTFIDEIFPDLSKLFNDENKSFTNLKKNYVIALLLMNDKEFIDITDIYRSGTLSGLDHSGKPYIYSSNLDYITNYVKERSYTVWDPKTNILIGEKALVCLTTGQNHSFQNLASRFYGELYYSLLIHFFQQLMLLNMISDYANLNIDEDKQKIQHLLYKINSFNANYFFVVYPADVFGQEFFQQIKQSLQIDQLYNNIKEVIFSLFKYEENTVTKKDSFLLLVLTLYTVICGIFSMNLFAADLKGKIDWNHLKSYNPFEYFAVFIVFSGIFVVVLLTLKSLFQGIKERKNRKKWIEETLWPIKKS